MFKRIILLAVALVVLLAFASQAQISNPYVRWERILSTDSLDANNDTVAAHVFYDTSWSDPFRLMTESSWMPNKTWTDIQLYWILGPDDRTAYKDTNWVNDTFFVYVQLGVKVNDGTYRWPTTTAVDTALVKDSSWSLVNLHRSSTVLGEWARIMLIHKDSLEAAIPTAKRGNSYGNRLDVYITATQ
jgi:hypothetical protein